MVDSADGYSRNNAIIVNAAGIWIWRAAGSFIKYGTQCTEVRYPSFGDAGRMPTLTRWPIACRMRMEEVSNQAPAGPVDVEHS